MKENQLEHKVPLVFLFKCHPAKHDSVWSDYTEKRVKNFTHMKKQVIIIFSIFYLFLERMIGESQIV